MEWSVHLVPCFCTEFSTDGIRKFDSNIAALQNVLKQDLNDEQMTLAEQIDIVIIGYGFLWKPISQKGAPLWEAFNVNPETRLQEIEAGLTEEQWNKLPDWFVQMYPRPNFVSTVKFKFSITKFPKDNSQNAALGTAKGARPIY